MVPVLYLISCLDRFVKAVIRAKELLLFPTTPEVLSVVPAIQAKVIFVTSVLLVISAIFAIFAILLTLDNDNILTLPRSVLRTV